MVMSGQVVYPSQVTMGPNEAERVARLGAWVELGKWSLVGGSRPTADPQKGSRRRWLALQTDNTGR